MVVIIFINYLTGQLKSLISNNERGVACICCNHRLACVCLEITSSLSVCLSWLWSNWTKDNCSMFKKVIEVRPCINSAYKTSCRYII